MSVRPVELTPRWLPLRWLLVVVIGAGVVAMHTLMGAGDGHGRDPMTASMGAVSMGAVSMGTAVGPASVSAAPGAGSAADASVGTPPAGHPGHHGDGSMSMLGHPCLAVLTVLLLVLAVPLALTRHRRALESATRPAGDPTCSSHPRAPPPTSVRLAELCLSRR
jgi:hypothetical protein